MVGSKEGTDDTVGALDNVGSEVGTPEGTSDFDGFMDDKGDGFTDGSADGCFDGSFDGILVGAGVMTGVAGTGTVTTMHFLNLLVILSKILFTDNNPSVSVVSID